MEKTSIKYTPDVIVYINELTLKLFEKEYFGFLESAIDYKDKIIDFIDNNINSFPAKSAPQKLIHLGTKYIFYKPNHRTTWYIFFEQKDDNFVITNIINNYCEEANWL